MLQRPIVHLLLSAVVAFVGEAASLTVAGAAPFDAANATYEFAGDTFTLSDGEAKIMGHSGMDGTPDTLLPMGYTLAGSASGELASGVDGAVVALYRYFGANLRWVVLFAFTDKDGTFAQTAASAAYKEDAAVESVSVDEGKVGLDLLVVSDADKALPHYAQKLTQPLTLNFTIDGDTFVKAP